jgi:hypothetical protein
MRDFEGYIARTRGIQNADNQHWLGTMDSGGLEIVLTPLQLAAVLESDTIDRTTCLSNCFWGAASVVGGAVDWLERRGSS